MKNIGNTVFKLVVIAAILALVAGVLQSIGGVAGKIGTFYVMFTIPLAVVGIVFSIIAIVKNSARTKSIISLILSAVLYLLPVLAKGITDLIIK